MAAAAEPRLSLLSGKQREQREQQEQQHQHQQQQQQSAHDLQHNPVVSADATGSVLPTLDDGALDHCLVRVLQQSKQLASLQSHNARGRGQHQQRQQQEELLMSADNPLRCVFCVVFVVCCVVC